MKVFVADDNELLRARLVNLLSEFPGVEIIGQARDASEALRAIRETRPDVVTLDIHMCGGSGISVLREIKREGASPVVLMLTNHVSPPYRKCCMEAGADFFLDKANGLDRVRDIFRTLLGRPDSTAT
ncbi:MAG TPA: response regulator transcription factor [Pyrinomonadaceae bacterium]|nr:response regulator transcription factor [Pyrinomonadaceae bacterium]